MRDHRDDIEPHRPFEEVQEFQGSISKGDREIVDQHFIVRYPTNRPGQIRGRIVGSDTREAADTFSALMRRPGSRYSIRSKQVEGARRSFGSDCVILRSTGSRYWPDEYTPSMVGVLGHLEFQDFSVWIDRERKGEKRRITLALAGPRDFWDLGVWREWRYTGEVKLSRDPLPISLPVEGVSARLEPHFVLSKSVLEDGHEVSIEDHFDSIVLETSLPPSDLSDDDFRKSSIELADDLLLLASIGARRRLDWFSYSFHGSDGLQQYIRTRSGPFEESVGHSDALISMVDATKYLDVSLKALRENRNRGFDLSVCLITVLTAHSSDLLEQRFLFLFTALEKLKDMFAASEKLQSNFRSNSERKRFLSEFASHVEGSLQGHPSLEDVKEKVPELGRPPLWSVLKKMLDQYDVAWQDVYPAGTEKPTFIGIRNKLLHTADQVDLPTLFYETDRLQVVLERLLLKLLGWDDDFGAASVDETERLRAGPSSGNIEVWD